MRCSVYCAIFKEILCMIYISQNRAIFRLSRYQDIQVRRIQLISPNLSKIFERKGGKLKKYVYPSPSHVVFECPHIWAKSGHPDPRAPLAMLALKERAFAPSARSFLGLVWASKISLSLYIASTKCVYTS